MEENALTAKTVLVAEKPKVAQAIASYLGGGKRADGYIDCGGKGKVTWCFGHLFELAEPDKYDKTWGNPWRFEVLPMIPDRWRKTPRGDKGVRKQVQTVRTLCAGADRVVHIGDPDREGQIIVDELLEFIGYNGPATRLWLSSVDEKSIRRAFGEARDNRQWAPLRDAAKARGRADWVIGMNMTRAMTLVGGAQGHQSLISIGRVQSPTLALVVERCRKIANFVPQDYFVPWADIGHPKKPFRSTYVLTDEDPQDEEGRLTDPKRGEAIAERARGQNATVTQASERKGTKSQPLPFSLSKLQSAASSRFGITAQGVLSALQPLWEGGHISYPRTDCQYLPEELLDDAPGILKKLAGAGHAGADTADTSIRSPAWNTKKVSAHYGIIPTEKVPTSLSGDAAKLYRMIAERYVLQFHPKCEYISRKILLDIDGMTFVATGREILKAGWTSVGKDDDGEQDEPPIPKVGKGDVFPVSDTGVDSKQTQPPPYFTDGSLITAMASIHRVVEDPEAKKRLKETEGIGTEATRASIIETLFKRQYLTRKGKKILSTALGEGVYDAMPRPCRDPVLTAQWESRLEMIARGEHALDAFMGEIEALTRKLVETAKKTTIKGAAKTQPCPECGGPMRRLKSKKSGKFFWACANREHPLVRDEKGKPGKQILPPQDSGVACPACGKGTLLKRQGAKGPFWGCSNYPECKHTAPDEDGKPGKREPREVEDSGVPCPICGEGTMVKRNGANGVFWSCSRYPECKSSLPDEDGKPKAVETAPCPEKGCDRKMIRKESRNKPGNFFWVCPNRNHPLRGDEDGKPGEAFGKK